MQRVHADRIPALLAHNLHQPPQIRVVPNTPVPLRAQQIHLCRHAPEPGAGLAFRTGFLFARQPAPSGRHNHRCFRAVALLQMQPVISPRQTLWKREHAPLQRLAFPLKRLHPLQRAELRSPAALAAILQDQPPPYRPVFRRKAHGHMEPPTLIQDHARRQRPRPLKAIQLPERRFRLAVVLGGQIHRL